MYGSVVRCRRKAERKKYKKISRLAARIAAWKPILKRIFYGPWASDLSRYRRRLFLWEEC